MRNFRVHRPRYIVLRLCRSSLATSARSPSAALGIHLSENLTTLSFFGNSVMYQLISVDYDATSNRRLCFKSEEKGYLTTLAF